MLRESRALFHFNESALRQLRNLTATPATGPPYLPFARLRIADGPLEAYTPKLGRQVMQGRAKLEPRKDRWFRREEDGDGSLVSMMAWSNVFSPRLEPKHQSLLWLMQQGVVTTAQQTRHFVRDSTSMCPICASHVETLQHYFYHCERIREFWRLLGCFLDRIRTDAGPSTPLELADVLSGLRGRRRSIPGAEIMYACAVWQVYRAHTEAQLDGAVVPAITIFARWQSEVINRIRSQLSQAVRTGRLDIFTRTWFSVRCQWFHFDTGDGASGRKRVVFNAAMLAPLPPPIATH